MKSDAEIEVTEDEYHAEQDAVIKASKKRITNKAKKEKNLYLEDFEQM